MSYSDDLLFDYDMNTDFIIIQSCLRDERHNEFIQNSDNIILLDDHLTFNLGDSFNSFESLKERLDAHSKLSNVHYWMRDSRTVVGARMKTTRRIEPRLKYYNVKYACVYGGHKFNSKGKGKRNSMTMKLDCPAHVKLRANRAGERLDVVAVCNHHNHAIGAHIYSHLRQERRLAAHLKEEVLDLLRLDVSKKRVMDYVRWKCGKTLLYKDVINMTALVKGSPEPAPQRRDMLLNALKRYEAKHRKLSPDNGGDAPEAKRRRRASPKKKKQSAVKIQTKMREEKVSLLVIKEDFKCDTGQDEEGPVDTALDTEVGIQYEDDESNHSMAHSNILKYLYQTDCDGESVIATLSGDQTVQYNLISPRKTILDNNQDVNSSQIINIEANSRLQNLTEPQEISIGEEMPLIVSEGAAQMFNGMIFEETEPEESIGVDAEHLISTSKSKNFTRLINGGVIFDDGEPQEISINDDIQHIATAEETIRMLNNNEIILEETWITDENVTYVNGEMVEVSTIDEIMEPCETDRCTNCDKIKLDLNSEVNMLRAEKRELLEETEGLKRERDSLLQEVRSLKGAQYHAGNPSHIPLMLKTVKGKSKFYVVKI